MTGTPKQPQGDVNVSPDTPISSVEVKQEGTQHTSMSNDSDILKPFKDLSPDKQLVILAATTFLVGAIVTSVFLGIRGIYFLELTHARYIAVGTLFLSFLLAVVVPLYNLLQTILNAGSFRVITKITRNLFSFVLLFVFLTIIAAILVGLEHNDINLWNTFSSVVLEVISKRREAFSFPLFLVYVLILYSSGAIVIIVGGRLLRRILSYILNFSNEAPNLLSQRAETLLSNYNRITSFTIILLVSIVSFAVYLSNVHANMPSQYGGGAGKRVAEIMSSNAELKKELSTHEEVQDGNTVLVCVKTFFADSTSSTYVLYRRVATVAGAQNWSMCEQQPETGFNYYIIPHSQIDALKLR